jgi:hypothetical protein
MMTSLPMCLPAPMRHWICLVEVSSLELEFSYQQFWDDKLGKLYSVLLAPQGRCPPINICLVKTISLYRSMPCHAVRLCTVVTMVTFML